MIDHKKAFLGSATVGERGQVAIPAEARRALEIKPGNKLLFFAAPHQSGLMVIKAEDLAKFLEHLMSKAETIEQLIKDIRNTDEKV